MPKYSDDWKKNPRCTGPEPYAGNYADLGEWLGKIGAVCNWQLARGRPGPGYSFLESWSCNGHVFIVEVQSEGKGWEIYTTGSTTRIDHTLLDAERRLGLGDNLDLLGIKKGT
jgi:hypothetical protein